MKYVGYVLVAKSKTLTDQKDHVGFEMAHLQRQAGGRLYYRRLGQPHAGAASTTFVLDIWIIVAILLDTNVKKNLKLTL